MTFKIWGTEDLTRTVANIAVDLPAITAMANGGYVAMWREGSSKFMYQVYDGNGVRITAQPILLEAGSTNLTPSFAQVTAIGTEGNFAVTWSESNGTSVSLFSRIYDANGIAISAPSMFVNGIGKQGAQVASNDSGGWAAAYIDGANVKLREFDSSGNDSATINVFVPGSSTNLDVAWLGQHKYLVTYQTNNGFTASIVDVTTNTVGAAFSLDSTTPVDIIGLIDPATGKPSGQFVVIKDTGATSVVAQRYSALGQKINLEVNIGGAKPNSDFDSVTAVALKNGGYAVAYIQADAAAGDFGDVYVKVVGANGIAGPELKINARAVLDSVGSQRSPVISEMADGRLSISWWDPTGSAGNGSNISTTIVDARAAKIKVDGTSRNDVYAPSEFTGDILDGKGGFDTLTFKGTTTGGVAVDLILGKGTAGDAAGDTYTSFEKVIGSRFSDTFTGGNGHVFVGGAGNDTYHVSGSTTIDESGGGYDQVFSSVTYTLSAGIENLFATGVNAINLTGNELSNIINGNGAANQLVGNGGNDTMNGVGGDDVLDGGTGNDILDGGAGNDKLYGQDGIDNLHGGIGNDALDGGTGDDNLLGGDGNDVLSGGIGNDYLQGGIGDDNLQGGDGNDALDGGLGNDALAGGNGNDNLQGGDGNDALDGGAGDDVINGGTGADVMNGGAGNDVYYIDNLGDQVIDGAGIDTVYLAVDGYDLARLGAVENFTGIGAVSITLTGNAFNNTMTGNDGANILKGGKGNDWLNGGAGNDKIYGQEGKDILTGGSGRDIFVFDKKPNKKTNVDRITDFNYRDDSIYVENKYFKVGSGSASKPKKMASKYFYAGKKAHDQNDRFIYDKKKGVLYYDKDGIGGSAQIKIATFDHKPKIKISDFFVI